MTEDASLDDFLDSDDGDERDGNERDDGGGDERDDGGSEPAVDAGTGGEGKDTADVDGEVEPATTTYAWTGDGAACETCGDVVERRWVQDGDLVCGACKNW